MSIFLSLKTWLEHCDQGHRCRTRLAHDESDEQKWPSRLLNVSPSNNPNESRLDTKDKTKPERYAALSYCWGEAPEDKSPPWRTLLGNLDKRCNGFMLHDLPQTLRDAVGVTRELGIQYLWIDSLYIIQDGDDWNKESKRMEAVFASAYCTVAATAATNSRSGFLKKEITDSASVKPGTGSGVNAPIVSADFDHDINKAPLNKRAWVMQERYLSPRTIHFSKSRVYGECGEGVYAGDNIMLQCNIGSNKYYQLDAQFPHRLGYSGFGSTMEFLQSLIEDYSGRGVTNNTDRPVAIAGLMSRTAKALLCRIHYGIIEWYLHRNLLWRRVSGQRTRKIEYEQFMPSWCVYR
ncbi:heterokaryon incompatibility protein-domain-containing protein [Xylariales sp. AK1849]|nr:heterokaryon incompatibility protein-domain-containing protein [Xylariales sp. AK1849]